MSNGLTKIVFSIPTAMVSPATMAKPNPYPYFASHNGETPPSYPYFASHNEETPLFMLFRQFGWQNTYKKGSPSE